MKPDEKALLKAFSNSKDDYPRIRDIAVVLGMPEKRLYHIVCKWADKNYYDWGTSSDLGWLTEEGKAWAIQLGIKR
jgi:hypothetical protein